MKLLANILPDKITTLMSINEEQQGFGKNDILMNYIYTKATSRKVP